MEKKVTGESKMFEKLRKSKLMFWSVEVLVIVLIIMGLSEISFIFEPVVAFFSTWLIPLVAALFLYYMFNPFIKMLNTRLHIKRQISVPILMVVLLGLIALGLVTLVPKVVHQVTQMVNALPQLVTDIQVSAAKASHYAWYQELNIGKYVNKLSAAKMATSIFKSFADGIPNLVGSVAGLFFSLITIPMVFFFMLKDGKKFVPSIQRLFPERYREEVGVAFARMDDTLSHYISGQALECLFVGVFMGTGYTIIGQPNALLLALIAMVTQLIPYLGPYIGAVPSVLLASTISWKQVAFVLAITVVVHLIDGNFIYPNVIGRSLDVHPLTIVIILLVVSHLYGVIGTVLAIPVYAVLKTIFIYFWQLFLIRRRKDAGKVAADDEAS